MTFVLDALVIYYLISCRSASRPSASRSRPSRLAQKTCPECLSEIPQDARRCKYCTAVLVRA